MSSVNLHARKTACIKRLAATVVITGVMAFQLSPSQAKVTGARARRLVDSAIDFLGKPKARNAKTQVAAQEFDPTRQANLVHHFKLCPRKLLLYSGESFTLVPLALDRNKEVVQGAAFEWQSKDTVVAGVSSIGEVTEAQQVTPRWKSARAPRRRTSTSKCGAPEEYRPQEGR